MYSLTYSAITVNFLRWKRYACPLQIYQTSDKRTSHSTAQLSCRYR